MIVANQFAERCSHGNGRDHQPESYTERIWEFLQRCTIVSSCQKSAPSEGLTYIVDLGHCYGEAW